MKALKKTGYKVALLALTLVFYGCGAYNFSGADIGTAESFQVNFFQNYADQNPGSTIEPGLDREFTNALQELINNLTSLSLTGSNGDLLYEGEIVEYKVTPMTATSDQLTAQNRLTMTVNVRFFNRTKEDADFERRFSFFFDFDAAASLPSVQAAAHEEIFDRITQDIFNASLGNW
ncbi:LPS assembly lipoprotein LptE [Muricauda sp. 2012CJ35-5]|uniref:LPS assembly lipoprotein LptE n=1 Tax=Flagellimonas spongiicola TaxID=2942208 RepID=A0ABT0PST1_9FLAO|nr:LptE family protein [Allomuricauda spongiicola]MCL6273802.1 LPS assembly lipoprotein LptE [Allomuricauda spongiicola]